MLSNNKQKKKTKTTRTFSHIYFLYFYRKILTFPIYFPMELYFKKAGDYIKGSLEFHQNN